MRRRLATIAAVVVLLAVGRPALASDPPPTLGIGLGYVRAKTVDPTIVFAGDFRFFLARNVALAPEVGYWKKSSRAVGIAASVKDLQFGLNVLGVVRPYRTVELFAGAGGGVHQVGGDLAVGSIQASETITKGGVDVTAGIVFEVADDVGFFLAGRYDWVLGLTGGSARRLDQYKVYGGFRLRF